MFARLEEFTVNSRSPSLAVSPTLKAWSVGLASAVCSVLDCSDWLTCSGVLVPELPSAATTIITKMIPPTINKTFLIFNHPRSNDEIIN